MEHDLSKASNMKLILCLFEQLSGLKIIFIRARFSALERLRMMRSNTKKFLVARWEPYLLNIWRYPIHYKKLLNSEWYPVETRFEGKLSCWKGKLLSYGDRLILVNSVLTSLPMFMLSFLQVPVGVRKRLDFYRSHFFWAK